MNKLFSSLLLVGLLSGCLPSARIDGGKLSYKSPAGAVITQKQSEDPKNTSTLNQEANRTETILLPAGSLLMSGTNCIKLSSNSLYTVTTHEKVVNTQGGAQKNVLGETIAKLASLRWLTYFGVVLFLAGLVTLFWPPVKLIVNSVTTSVAISAGGLFLTFAPVLIVGHEILILSAVVGVIGIWWFSHHHSAVSTELKLIKSKLTSSLTKSE